MQQIAEWLKGLGLSEYAERFAENGIDVSVLRYLTDQDLENPDPPCPPFDGCFSEARLYHR
jgi:hypothetical protein